MGSAGGKEAQNGPGALASTLVVGAPGAPSPGPRALPSPAQPQGDGSQSPDSVEEESRRRTIRQAMRIGLWVWPCFALLDAYMCFVLYPEAPFGLFVVYRIAVELVFWAVYGASRRPRVPLRVLAGLQRLTFFLAALGISLMAVHLGGLRSAYMHGISLVCLVHAAVMPEPWRRSLLTFVAIAAAFPLVMGVSALLMPWERAEWYSVRSLAVFASNFVFVAASSVVGMASGHAVWAARQQVYKARQLGRYRLQALIGTGGMGEVWLAWDGGLRRNVALKILRMKGAASPDMVRRFEREAYTASQLVGPHTARIYDFGASDDGIYYIAMEYLDGADLYTLVREHGPLAPARAVGFMMQACISLDEAHRAGIVHRDIKPQNLFLTPVGEDGELLKLLDFGIVRIQPVEPDAELTRTGAMLGTPPFMAPEIWHGAPADARSDIYALGATFYFLVTGEAPFESDTLGGFQRAHLGQAPVAPSVRRGEALPEGIDGIALRCLEKLPDRRFQSVRELRAVLAEANDPAGWTPAEVRRFWAGVRPLPGRQAR